MPFESNLVPLCSDRENGQCWPGLADSPAYLAQCSLPSLTLQCCWVIPHLGPGVCTAAMREVSCSPQSAANLMENFVVRLKQGVEETCSGSLTLLKHAEDGLCKVHPSKPYLALWCVCLVLSVLTKLILNSVSASLYAGSSINSGFIRANFTVLDLHRLNKVTTCKFN